jgi:hypothetical protein
MTRPSSSRWASAALALLVVAAACAPTSGAAATTSSPGGPVASGGAPGASGVRPSSPAVVKIMEPESGASLAGPTVHVTLTLTGAQIVQATTTAIRPDQGHVHLYVNNQLVSMNYALENDLKLSPGTYVIKAEFVASDHVPFNPRVWSPEVYFTVTG